MTKRQFFTVMIALFMISTAFAQKLELIGAGATFPMPLYSRMFDEYSKVKVPVNYQGIGSGGGINQLIEKITDFGGTDAILTADQQQKAGGEVLHIPTCLGAVVITYNLAGIGNVPLKFTSDVIADIYMGKITSWNDSKIATLNPNIKLPRQRITVIYRADASGTSSIFTDYLAKTNNEWREKVGTGTSVTWPVGEGARGNPGVSSQVSQTPGAIGYVELVFALSNNLPYADIQNKSGNFITPNMESVSLAANISIPADGKVSLTNTDAEMGYPISSFTWVILYREQNYNNRSIDKAKATVDLIQWMITNGQVYAEPLHYAPLPEAARKVGLEMLKSVVYNGKNM